VYTRRTPGLQYLNIALAALLVAAVAVADVAAAEDVRELGRLTAKAAIVVDVDTGQVHFARNPTLQLPPASTTKLLTGMIALRQTAPGELFAVSKYASSMPASKAWLRPGWTLSARDLLYALMLRSANDASVVIAEGVAGSVPDFAQLMNATARSIGATQSNFVTPNGLPATGHYSTAGDLATIMRHALQTPGMRELLSTPTAVIQPVSGSRKRIALRSTNKLLWRDDLHVIGKTGYTRQAKRCFVGAASASGREVIVAVLGSTNLWGDVELLATYGLDQVAPDWRQKTGYQMAALSKTDRGATTTGWGQIAAPPPSRVRGRMTAQAPSASGQFASNRSSRRARAAEGDRDDLQRAKLRYHLQVGSYRSKARAGEVAKQVSKRGYRASLEHVSGIYRVSIRDFSSRDAARRAARSLKRTLRVDPIIVASR
jgi:D-alanyl-D-alanine carboxypeptidase (penicillin-binding protein 5/6)